jgi:hypothetical protein
LSKERLAVPMPAVAPCPTIVTVPIGWRATARAPRAASANSNGIAQKPIDGVSMACTFDKANADVPSPHRTQYFEMMGVQGAIQVHWQDRQADDRDRSPEANSRG